MNIFSFLNFSIRKITCQIFKDFYDRFQSVIDNVRFSFCRHTLLLCFLSSPFFCLLISNTVIAQKITISENGDTLNKINAKGKKIGKWVIDVPELRGEPGYVEEGEFVNGEKDGVWRKYSTVGDLIGLEYYILGGKAGVQKYFDYLGRLERVENWRAYNPDAPYDTIPIYGTGNGEIVSFKIVKSQPYSVKDGKWKYYNPETGALVKTENWDRNVLILPDEPQKSVANEKPKKIDKTPEMLEWEKKNRGKKGALRDGQTSY